MSLEVKIMTAIKVAMKAKDKNSLEALRAVKAALLMESTKAEKEALTEAQENALLQKQIKQRRDAAEQFSAQDRNELAQKETNQASVIEAFLPKQMTKEELNVAIKSIVEEVGATKISDIGKVMGVASKKLSGKADGKSIAESVKLTLGNL